MRYHLMLQLSIISRKIKEAGIKPILGYLLAIGLFIVMSELLFHATGFAKYIVCLAALALIFRLNERDRSDFLLSNFGCSGMKKIRIIENITLCAPFITILIIKTHFTESAILLILGIIAAVTPIRTNFYFTIPTPFSRSPFEFTVGFRKTFLLFLFTYFLAIIAIKVNNPNLGLFAMITTFIIPWSYYTKPEDDFYIWVHSDTPNRFLFRKLAIASINVSILSLPILTALLIFFHERHSLILLLFFAGLIFQHTVILAKYSAFPREIGLVEAIFLVLSIYFPPLLLAIIPFFYIKSINKLKLLLK